MRLEKRMSNGLVLSAAALVLLFATSCEKKAAPKPEPLKVEVITVTPRETPIYQQWVGTLDGYPNAQIRAQVSGYVMKQDYAEGAKVKEGDLLFEIDPRPFQAVLDQTKAKLAQDVAQLGKTELDVKRFTPLAKDQAISQQELDDAVQANLMAKALVEADNAAIATATLNLGFTRITSPVSGIAGRALAQIGDLVGPGGGVLTTVSTVDPIRAYFNISEQFYLKYCQQYTNELQRSVRDSEMRLMLVLSDGSAYPRPGKWFFTSRQIDVNTGTLQVAGVFDNPDSMLRPGQYALIRAQTELRKRAVLVPQRAVAELQGAYQVSLVDEENKVHVKTVKVGDQVGTEWLIENGLEAGQRVIVEGTQKVKEGTVVNPQPFQPLKKD